MELWDVLDADGNKVGKIHERGKPMAQGEYHLVVDVWIMDGKGNFLISKRTATKHPDPDKWEPTCGCAIMHDDSLSAALREVEEELGITLNPQNGKMIKRFKVGRDNIVDVWLFRQEVDIDTVILHPEETSDVMWATMDTIRQLINNSDFINAGRVPYVEELFQMCE